MPDQTIELAVHHPKLGAPTLGRQIVAAVAVLLERAHDLVDHLIVVAQEYPVAMVAVLFLQRFAQHIDALLVAALDVIDKAALKADAHPQCMVINTSMQVAKMARNSFPVMPILIATSLSRYPALWSACGWARYRPAHARRPARAER